LCVCWNVVDTRGSAPSGRHTEIDGGGENIFWNFYFIFLKRWPAKEIFLNVSGIFHGRLRVGTDHRKKNEHGREERPNEFVTAWLYRTFTSLVLLLLFLF
jgi:hypothetical protein